MPVDVGIFKTAAPYRSFNEGDWKVLSEILHPVNVGQGQAIFKEGDPGDGFYFIVTGKIKIRRMVDPEEKGRRQEQLLTILSAGQLFGEMALVDGAPRSADALAEDVTVLYHLPQADYDALKKEHPGTALRIQDLLVTTLSWRLREANRSFEIIQFWLA